MNDEVADAIRREHDAVESTSPHDLSDPGNRLEVKVNFAVALMQLGNYAASAEYGQLYAESESLLLSVLELVPDHAESRCAAQK